MDTKCSVDVYDLDNKFVTNVTFDTIEQSLRYIFNEDNSITYDSVKLESFNYTYFLIGHNIKTKKVNQILNQFREELSYQTV